jgi:streptomycin 6-kinase
MKLPARLQQNILAFEGGAAWLAQLPKLIALCEKRWQLRIESPFDELSYNYVTKAQTLDGQKVVLKLGVPNRELTTEIAALQHYGGRGAVRLIDSDAEWGVLLLERLQPGTMLVAEIDDEQATRIAATVMRALWRPAPIDHAFPTVADWALGFGRYRNQFRNQAGPITEKWIDSAESIFAELLADSAEPILLHGDLHHYNILQAQRTPWLVIDPKGVIGEPAYEVGALLRNPLTGFFDQSNALQRLTRRVAIFEEMLGFDRKRILKWSLAQAVLSACWSVEDDGDPSFAIARATQFARLQHIKK